jgi:hypothetical protein
MPAGAAGETWVGRARSAAVETNTTANTGSPATVPISASRCTACGSMISTARTLGSGGDVPLIVHRFA